MCKGDVQKQRTEGTHTSDIFADLEKLMEAHVVASELLAKNICEQFLARHGCFYTLFFTFTAKYKKLRILCFSPVSAKRIIASIRMKSSTATAVDLNFNPSHDTLKKQPITQSVWQLNHKRRGYVSTAFFHGKACLTAVILMCADPCLPNVLRKTTM